MNLDMIFKNAVIEMWFIDAINLYATNKLHFKHVDESKSHNQRIFQSVLT